MGNELGNQEQHAWVHWDYAPDEWARLDRMDWGPIRHRYWLTFAVVMGILVLLSVCLILASIAFMIPLLLLIGLAVIYNVLPSTDYRQAKKRHQARQDPAHPHRVTLSSQGLWGFGATFPFTGMGALKHEINVQVNKVWLTAQPTTLHFQVEHLKLTSTSHGILPSPASETIHLLVPAGHESEAEQVAQRFRTEVIEDRDLAMKRFREEQANPPEPR